MNLNKELLVTALFFLAYLPVAALLWQMDKAADPTIIILIGLIVIVFYWVVSLSFQLAGIRMPKRILKEKQIDDPEDSQELMEDIEEVPVEDIGDDNLAGFRRLFSENKSGGVAK